MIWLTYLVTLIIFFVIDLLWLGIVAKNFYDGQIGHLRGANVNWFGALSFYFLFNLGLLLFAINPGIESGSIGKALSRGAQYGFFTYMTYDLTNLATLKSWPVKLTIVDILWGVVLCSLVSLVVYLVMGLI
jgi:uncharacterized membrane protein